MPSEDEDKVVHGGETPDDGKGNLENSKDSDKEKSRPKSSTILPAIRPKQTDPEEEARKEKQLREGIEALKAYELEKLSECIDAAAESSQLHNRGHAAAFKQKVLEIGEVAFGGTSAWFEFLNRNSYIAGALDFVDNYFSQNPEEAGSIAKKAEEYIGIKFTECGFDRPVYEAVIEAVKQNGIVGEGSGLDVLIEAGIRNLGSIVKAVHESDADLEIPRGTLNFMGQPIEKQPSDLAELCTKCRITVQGVKRAYKKGKITGYGGVVHYLFGKTVSGMAGEFEEELQSLNLKPSDIVNAYKNNGIVAKEGIADVLAMALLENLPNAEEAVYNVMIYEILKEKKEAMKKQAMRSMQIGAGSQALETEINRLIESKFEAPLKVIKSVGVPQELNAAVLRKVCGEYGLFGSKGLISYFADNAEKIFANAVAFDLVEKRDIEMYAAKARKLANLSSAKDFLNALSAGKMTTYEKFALGTAKKAQELGVPAADFLRKPEYLKERMHLKKEVYGGIIEAYQGQVIMITEAIPIVGGIFRLAQSGELDVESLIESGKKELPEKGILRSAFDYVVEKYASQNLAEIIEDCTALTKGLFIQKLGQMTVEMKQYVDTHYDEQ